MSEPPSALLTITQPSALNRPRVPDLHGEIECSVYDVTWRVVVEVSVREKLIALAEAGHITQVDGPVTLFPLGFDPDAAGMLYEDPT